MAAMAKIVCSTSVQ